MNPAADTSSLCAKNLACILYLSALLAGVVPHAFGYTTTTHAAMTRYAAIQSKITADPLASPIFRKLGLIEVVAKDYPDPFRTLISGDYVAQTEEPMWLRADAEFESKILGELRDLLKTDVAIPGDSTIIGWMMRGAVREDDNWKENPASDEPGGVFTRMYGHFYDPHNNKGSVLGVRAPDWALDPNTIMASRRNLYNIPGAREAMWRALTGTRKDGESARPENSSPFTTDWEIRKGYWATVFRALGDAVHVLQDMAQPQHTRDDAHSGYYCLPSLGCPAGHDSFYEKYINARSLKKKSFALKEGFRDLADVETIEIEAIPLNFGPYDTPRFDRYSDFFSTGSGTDANAAGRGLANYSNRGFYSAGTNIGFMSLLLGYPSPDPTGDTLTREVVVGTGLPDSSLKDIAGTSLAGKVTFLKGEVQDNLRGSPDVNVRLSTLGYWDQFLRPKSGRPAYSLNHYNYKAMADLLIPRAVAYSAGLIDFFFRGEMQITLPDEGVYSVVDHSKVRVLDSVSGNAGFNKIKLKLMNVTSTGDLMSNGVLVAVMKFHRNLCFENDLRGYPPFVDWSLCRTISEEIVVSNSVNVNSALTFNAAPTPFEFSFPTVLPLNATDVQLQVVFRGRLGNEDDAVVVATKDIAEPTFFSYQNTSDYIRIGAKVYTRDEVNTIPGLLAMVQPQSLVDYAQSPPRLRATSLLPFPLALDFSFDPQRRTSVRIDNMQPGEFVRLAILGDALPPGATSPSTFTVISDAVHQCLPSQSFVVPVNGQETYVPSSHTLVTSRPQFYKARGVYGWAMTGCVSNGDGLQPGPDDRDQKMVVAPNDNPSPVAVVINGGAGF